MHTHTHSIIRYAYMSVGNIKERAGDHKKITGEREGGRV